MNDKLTIEIGADITTEIRSGTRTAAALGLMAHGLGRLFGEARLGRLCSEGLDAFKDAIVLYATAHADEGARLVWAVKDGGSVVPPAERKKSARPCVECNDSKEVKLDGETRPCPVCSPEGWTPSPATVGTQTVMNPPTSTEEPAKAAPEPAKNLEPHCVICGCGSSVNNHPQLCAAAISGTCARHARDADEIDGVRSGEGACEPCARIVEQLGEELRKAGPHGATISDLERNVEPPSPILVHFALMHLERRRLARQRGLKRNAWFDAKSIARVEGIRREGPKHSADVHCFLCGCDDKEGGMRCGEHGLMGECGRADADSFAWKIPGARRGEAYCAPCGALLRDVARQLEQWKEMGTEAAEIAAEIGEATPDVAIALDHLEGSLAQVVEGRWYPAEKEVTAGQVCPYGLGDRVKILRGAYAQRLGSIVKIRDASLDGFTRLVVMPDAREQSRVSVDEQVLGLVDVEPIMITPKTKDDADARVGILVLLERARAAQMRQETANGGGNASASMHAAKEAVNRGHHLALGAAGGERGNAVAYLRRLSREAQEPLRELLTGLAMEVERAVLERKAPAPGDEILLKLKSTPEGLLWVEPPPGGPAHLEAGHSVREDDFACLRGMVVRFEIMGDTTSQGARFELAQVVRAALGFKPKQIANGLEFLEAADLLEKEPEKVSAGPAQNIPVEPPKPSKKRAPRAAAAPAEPPPPAPVEEPAPQNEAEPEEPEEPSGKRSGRPRMPIPEELLDAVRKAVQKAGPVGVQMGQLVEACDPHPKAAVVRAIEELTKRREIHDTGKGRGCKYHHGAPS